MSWYYGSHHHSYNNPRITQAFEEVKKDIAIGNIQPDGDIVDTPEKITLTLKLHQQRMVAEMLKKESSYHRISSGINMGVLSDKVGSGKSLITLALIASQRIVANAASNDLPYLHAHTYDKRSYRYINDIGRDDFIGFDLNPTHEFMTNLVVVPHNIFGQWLNYLNSHTTLKYKSFGSVRDFRCFSIDTMSDYDVVLILSLIHI